MNRKTEVITGDRGHRKIPVFGMTTSAEVQSALVMVDGKVKDIKNMATAVDGGVEFSVDTTDKQIALTWLRKP